MTPLYAFYPHVNNCSGRKPLGLYKGLSTSSGLLLLIQHSALTTKRCHMLHGYFHHIFSSFLLFNIGRLLLPGQVLQFGSARFNKITLCYLPIWSNFSSNLISTFSLLVLLELCRLARTIVQICCSGCQTLPLVSCEKEYILWWKARLIQSNERISWRCGPAFFRGRWQLSSVQALISEKNIWLPISSFPS